MEGTSKSEAVKIYQKKPRIFYKYFQIYLEAAQTRYIKEINTEVEIMNPKLKHLAILMNFFTIDNRDVDYYNINLLKI